MIEHIPTVDRVLARVKELLRLRGIVALALPDAGSRVARALGKRWWSVIPTHVHYCTRRSVGTLLDRCGFVVLDFATSPKAFTVGYYAGRLDGYGSAVAKRLVAGTRRMESPIGSGRLTSATGCW